MTKYKILHLSTGMYIYRSILDTTDKNNILYGEFYSEWEMSSNRYDIEREFTNIFDNKDIFIILKKMLKKHNKEAYFSYEKDYNKKAIDRIEHFELIEVDENV